jgi:hypothetical protein
MVSGLRGLLLSWKHQLAPRAWEEGLQRATAAEQQQNSKVGQCQALGAHDILLSLSRVTYGHLKPCAFA